MKKKVDKKIKSSCRVNLKKNNAKVFQDMDLIIFLDFPLLELDLLALKMGNFFTFLVLKNYEKSNKKL